MNKMNKVKIIVSVVLAVVALIVIIQNGKPAEVSFLFWHGEFSLALLFFIAVLLGFIIGLLLPVGMAHRRRHLEQVRAEQGGAVTP